MKLDKDLQSIQEARYLARIAKEAQQEYKYFEQAQVDKIVKAMAEAGYAKSRDTRARILAAVAYEDVAHSTASRAGRLPRVVPRCLPAGRASLDQCGQARLGASRDPGHATRAFATVKQSELKAY